MNIPNTNGCPLLSILSIHVSGWLVSESQLDVQLGQALDRCLDHQPYSAVHIFEP